MQLAQGLQRCLWGTNLEGRAMNRIELPCGHYRDDTGLELDMSGLSGPALLD